MALSANTVWEVRGGAGNDNNGGGFVKGATGVDRSQQDSAFASGTNLTVDATTNTDVTPDGHAVSTDDVGNTIQITAGAGFTTGFYQIVSIQGGTKWRLDRSPAATSTSGGTWALGGALNTIGKAFGPLISGHTIFIKAATYTLTAKLQATGSVDNITIIGYNSSRTEYLTDTTIGTRPLITTATNSVRLWANPNGGGTRVNWAWFNLRMTNTAAARDACFEVVSTSWNRSTVYRCSLSGFSTTYAYSSAAASGWIWRQSDIQNATGNGIDIANNGNETTSFVDCLIGNNASIGVAGSDSTDLMLQNCLIVRNGSHGVTGVQNNRPAIVMRCVFEGNTGDGLRIVASAGSNRKSLVTNSIFSGNGGYGINRLNANSQEQDTGGWNAFYSNTSGARNNYPTLPGDVTLSADPFTNAAGGDYTLNNTAGGGAACKGAGSPSTIP